MGGDHGGPGRPRHLFGFHCGRAGQRLARGFAHQRQLLELLAERACERFRRCLSGQKALAGQRTGHHVQRVVDFVEPIGDASGAGDLAEGDRQRRGIVKPFDCALGTANGDDARVGVGFAVRNDAVKLHLRDVEEEVGHVDPCPEFVAVGNVAWLRCGPQVCRIATVHGVGGLHERAEGQCLRFIERAAQAETSSKLGFFANFAEVLRGLRGERLFANDCAGLWSAMANDAAAPIPAAFRRRYKPRPARRQARPRLCLRLRPGQDGRRPCRQLSARWGQ